MDIDTNEFERLRNKAEAKGIDLRYGNLFRTEKAFAAIVHLYGILYQLDEEGKIQDYRYKDGPFYTKQPRYVYTFDQAEHIVDSYDPDSEKKRIHFYGFMRQYDGESDSIFLYQQNILKMYAEKVGFSYKCIYGCKGRKEKIENFEWLDSLDPNIAMCEEGHEKYILEESVGELIKIIHEDPLSVIVVADGSRYDGYTNLDDEQQYLVAMRQYELDSETIIYPYKDEYWKEWLEEKQKWIASEISELTHIGESL